MLMIQYCTVRYRYRSTVRYSKVRYVSKGTVWYSTVAYGTVRYGIVNCFILLYGSGFWSNSQRLQGAVTSLTTHKGQQTQHILNICSVPYRTVPCTAPVPYQRTVPYRTVQLQVRHGTLQTVRYRYSTVPNRTVRYGRNEKRLNH
jgi:hypothetical protein